MTDPAPLDIATPADRPANLASGRRFLARAAGRLHASGEAALHRVTDAAERTLRTIAGGLVRGQTTLRQWFKKSAAALVTVHFAGALAVNRDATPPPDALSDLEARVNRQAGYLARFRRAIRDGAVPRGLGLVARAGSYGLAVWSVAQNVGRLLPRPPGPSRVPGVPRGWERRILDDGPVSHCATCPQQAAMGWCPPGVLLAVGQSECGIRCRCHFTYS